MFVMLSESSLSSALIISVTSTREFMQFDFAPQSENESVKLIPPEPL